MTEGSEKESPGIAAALGVHGLVSVQFALGASVKDPEGAYAGH